MRKDIENALKRLIKEISYSFKVDLSKELFITTYNPGEGWIRYRLCERFGETGESHITCNMNHAEMLTFLNEAQQFIALTLSPRIKERDKL